MSAHVVEQEVKKALASRSRDDEQSTATIAAAAARQQPDTSAALDAAPAAAPPPPQNLGCSSAAAAAPLLSPDAEDKIALRLASVWLALLASIAAVRSAAVRAAVTKAAKPILVAAVAQYAVLSIVLAPVSAVLRVLAFFTGARGLAFSATRAAAGSVACVYPLVAGVLTRYAHRAALRDTFFAALAEFDPARAAALKAAPVGGRRGVGALLARLFGSSSDGGGKGGGGSGSGGTDDGDELWLVALMLACSVLRFSPLATAGIVGAAITATARFFAIRQATDRPRVAAALAVACAVARPVEPLLMGAVDVWANALALARASLRHFLTRAVPAERHGSFVRENDVTLVAYFAPPALALRLAASVLSNVAGPLLLLPCAHVAAHIAARCVWDISTQKVKVQ